MIICIHASLCIPKKEALGVDELANDIRSTGYDVKMDIPLKKNSLCLKVLCP